MSAPESAGFLHRRLLEGDPTAPERLVAACLVPLQKILRRRHPALPRDAVADATNDALIALIKHPEHYDPRRGVNLLNFLVMIADRRLIDWLRALRRRQQHEISVGGTVELELWEANNPSEGDATPFDLVDDPDTLPPELDQWLREALPDPRDRRLLDLIGAGRQETAEYAAVLEITHLPTQEQRAEVKRHRDRILKRLERRREEFRRLYDG